MSNPEQDTDVVVGKDGQEGFLSAGQKEWLTEEHPDLAPYKDLKFRVDDDDNELEPSTEMKAHGATAKRLKQANQEVSRLKKQANERDLAEGVGELLDRADEVAATLDWEEADEVRRDAQHAALRHASAIEDEDLRQRTFQRLEQQVDEDLYEAFVGNWQQAYTNQTERDVEQGLENMQQKVDEEMRIFGSVVQLESDLLATLGPLEQACAVKLLDSPGMRDEIAEMDPATAQEAIRMTMEMGRVAAAKMEEAYTQEQIVKAHGKTRGGPSGRALREMDMHSLGFLPDLNATDEETEAALRRSQKGVRVDRQKAKRIHKGTGATGMERFEAQQIRLAKEMGIEVVDAQSGKRLG